MKIPAWAISGGLLVISNVFMTFAWYAHFKNMATTRNVPIDYLWPFSAVHSASTSSSGVSHEHTNRASPEPAGPQG
ncbi:MAG: DMT family protein [Steroidobacteraceae bacterium]|nr:DMT family protein [Steroidobacteraceae bacterium]